MRYKYLMTGYIIGYFISFTATGIPQWKYLIPVKIIGFLFAFTIGNLLYYIIEEKEHFYVGAFRTMKYVIPALVLLIVLLEIQTFLFEVKGVDIEFISGLPKS